MYSIITHGAAWLKARLGSDEGATAVEYGIMVFLIAVAIIAIVLVLGETLYDVFSEVVVELGGTPP